MIVVLQYLPPILVCWSY